MRQLGAILTWAVLSTPAMAFDPMSLSDCRSGWLSFVDMMSLTENERAEAEAVSHRVTDDGWCRLSGADPALDGARFATLEWQAEGWETGDFPMGLRVRVNDMRAAETAPPSRTDFVPQPPLDLDMTLRRLPDSRQLLLEELRLTSPAGDDLQATAVFDRVDLSSHAMAQMSMGSILLRQLNVKIRLNGWVESQIVPSMDIAVTGDDAAIREAAGDVVRRLPPELFGEQARANLLSFTEAWPAPRGDLELAMVTDYGVGMMQVVLFGWSAFGSMLEPDEVAGEATEILGGLTIEAIWTPDPDQTE